MRTNWRHFRKPNGIIMSVAERVSDLEKGDGMVNGPYMNHEHPDAFKDMGKKPIRPYYPENPVECPKCHGYGGWNLRLNSYGPGQHFQAGCSQCQGYGYVRKGSLDESCIHKWVERSQEWVREYNQAVEPSQRIHHWGMHCNVNQCEHCGKIWVYDSSD